MPKDMGFAGTYFRIVEALTDLISQSHSLYLDLSSPLVFVLP